MQRFLQIARGSASEVEYHLLLAKDLGFLSPADFKSLEEQIFEIQRMLASLSARVRLSLSADEKRVAARS
jgi:four helix bundle protein